MNRAREARSLAYTLWHNMVTTPDGERWPEAFAVRVAWPTRLRGAWLVLRGRAYAVEVRK